jgi:P-type Cu+ transporter
MNSQRTSHEHVHHRGQHHDHHGPAQEAGATTLVTDPVCGTKVDPATSTRRMEHGGGVFHFCSAGCRDKFASEPAKYLAPKAAASAPASGGGEAIYTCPMHPEVRQKGPGNCPICGMALEPLSITAEAGPNPELVDMTRRFWVGLALTLPIVVLEMGTHVPALGLHHLVPPRLSAWVMFLLATPVVLWAGWPFFVRGWASVVNRSLNMFTLIALGTGAAYATSRPPP